LTPKDTHQHLIDTLQNTYGDTLYTHNGVTYPIVLFPAPPEQHNDVDSVLVPEFPREFVDPATFAVYDSAHLNERVGSRPGMTNGVTYDMAAMMESPMQIRANLGRYFDMMATCDALDWEMRDFAAGKRDSLPLREQLHAQIPPGELPHNGTGRGAVIGVAVLTVFKHNGHYQMIVAQRSAKLATGAGLYHIVPAFVFQPSGPEAFYAAEWSVKHQIIREFGEELFAMPEYDQWDNDDNPVRARHAVSLQSADYFYDYPPVAVLRAMLTDGRAELFLTGVAFNLLSCRPEICALLVIHEADWYPQSEKLLQKALTTERQETRYIPIESLDGLPDDLHLRMTPQGAAAMWQGIKKARGVLRK
jgi:hypothetical protein